MLDNLNTIIFFKFPLFKKNIKQKGKFFYGKHYLYHIKHLSVYINI